jgi:nicotinamidase-related amidase
MATVANTLPLEITEDMCAGPYYVKYGKRAAEARALRRGNDWQQYWDVPIKPAGTDTFKVGVMLIDAQGTFCYPVGGDDGNGELYVGGVDGRGAINDSLRTANWVLRNLPYITKINCTMDTHTLFQVFHESFFVCGQAFECPVTKHQYSEGDHPLPMTFIDADEILGGRWSVNPEVAWAITGRGDVLMALQKQVEHYVKELKAQGKYTHTIWPYHAMIGGPNHALVSAIEEVTHFHGAARGSQPNFEIKGGNPLTENYSVLRPEVLTKPDGTALANKNVSFIEMLMSYDALFIAGQAKSHCVAWTIDDLLGEILQKDPELTKRVWLLSDCSTPVVVPGIIDFTEQADQAFDRFKAAGMNVVDSSTPLSDILPV